MASGSGVQYLRTGGPGPVQQWLGIYYGYIAVNQDPTAQGRVKLRVPQVFGNVTSGWAAPMVPLTFIPKVGTSVTVMFVGGDPTQPVWFGNFAVPGESGTSVTSGTAAPSDSPDPVPVVGSLYYRINTSGTILGMYEWNGAGWVDYYVGGSYIASGTVVPGIINGTTVNAATLENSASNPKTSINPDGSTTITNSSGDVIYKVGPDGTVTWYSAAGAQLMQLSPTGVLSITDPALIEFPSGQTWESTTPANIQSGVGGTSPAQYISMVLTGPATSNATARDRVWVGFNSSAENASLGANLEFIYQGSNGTNHEQAYLDVTGFNITAGTIIASEPGVTPAYPESWKTLSLNSGWGTGSNNNGYTDVPMIRMLADNKMMILKGILATPSSGSVLNTPFASVPASYPNANFGGPYGRSTAITNLTGGTSGWVQIQNNGNLSLGGGFGNSETIALNCIIPTQ